jgi:hypothetical protein
MLITVQICAFVQRALNADSVDSWDIEFGAHPTGQVLIGRDFDRVIQVAIVQRPDRFDKRIPKRIHLSPNERHPASRQLRPNLGCEAVAM